MWLVESPDQDESGEGGNRAVHDYQMSQVYNQLDRLVYRVMQLHDILKRRIKSENANPDAIRHQIEEAQDRLDELYRQIH